MGNKDRVRPVDTFDPTNFEKKLELARKLNWLDTNHAKWFRDNGWDISYEKGLVDETPHYTRIDEDCIIMKNHRYILQINIPSCTTVLQLLNDNSDCYGGKPTMFLTNTELFYLSELMDDIDIVVNYDFES